MSFEPETLRRGASGFESNAPSAGARGRGRSAIVAALSVYAEPLVAGSRVLVVGEASPDAWTHLLEMDAESVTLVDPDPARARRVAALAPRGVAVRGDADLALDVRDGAFDLAIVADVARLPEPEAVVRRLRRVVDPAGAVVAIGRAQGEGGEGVFPELGAPVVDYEGLYDLFALSFEHVTMAGVLPFAGVVFAELGAETDDVAVSVDTRLATEVPAPSVFVVLASREARALDPYAIVQAPADARPRDAGSDAQAQAAFAAMQLRADLLASQLDEMRTRVAQAEAGPRSARLAQETDEVARLRRSESELTSALTRVALERDAALVRVVELEAAAARLAEGAAVMERRVLAAEHSMSERERALAVAEGELEHVATQHASELLQLEEQLQERARTVAEHEREIGRREELVRDLVSRLEELREAPAAEHAAMPAEPARTGPDTAALEQKLDALALDVARRESEIVARGWKVRELEASLARAQGEIDALRQALAQEHAARVAAEGSAAEVQGGG